MNDPGLDEPIQDAEKALEKNHDSEWGAEAEEEELLLDPSRWWFASTASPLIAGTFGPMASAFNICALAEYWREYIPKGTVQDTGHSIKDPAWLYAVNGLSLAFAILGNGTLLANMMGRLNFRYAQPITIVGFSMASLLLIVLVAVANTDIFLLKPYSDHALTQAFYFACWAAGLYTIIGILMGLTVYGAIMNKYPKQFEINNSQRTLMLQTISFMAYLLVGATIYHHLEGWRFLNAMYWANFTLLTIGFGTPLVPLSHAGRALIFPFTFGGILAVGLIIGSIRSMLLEKGAQKMHARATEKKRQQILHLSETEVRRSKFNWFKKEKRPSHRMDTDKLPERDRRREEFLAMRHILQHAEKKQRWTALFFSTMAAAVLWFMGALVFYFTEKNQSWTYFESLYFAYVSLITLGYGDFQPTSNAGKSFFVLWSLLAIPTLTVLISDMGNTVVKGLSEATNYFSSVTINPDEGSFWRDLRDFVSAVSGGYLFRKSAAADEDARKKKRERLLRRVKRDEDPRLGKFPDLLYARLSDAERDAIDNYGQNAKAKNERERDMLFYHFLLVKEVRAVLADCGSVNPRTYTYDEWAYFLKLLGQDEDEPEWHTKRYNVPKKDDEDAPQVGRILDHDGKPKAWSWLSLRSPLLSTQSEPEWILHRLLAKLQGEIHFERHMGRDEEEEKAKKEQNAAKLRQRHGPPLSVDHLVKTWTGKTKDNNALPEKYREDQTNSSVQKEDGSAKKKQERRPSSAQQRSQKSTEKEMDDDEATLRGGSRRKAGPGSGSGASSGSTGDDEEKIKEADDADSGGGGGGDRGGQNGLQLGLEALGGAASGGGKGGDLATHGGDGTGLSKQRGGKVGGEVG